MEVGDEQSAERPGRRDRGNPPALAAKYPDKPRYSAMAQLPPVPTEHLFSMVRPPTKNRPKARAGQQLEQPRQNEIAIGRESAKHRGEDNLDDGELGEGRRFDGNWRVS